MFFRAQSRIANPGALEHIGPRYGAPCFQINYGDCTDLEADEIGHG
jgi:hypothetical protein